jgi:signal transduction histidine kinase
MRLRLTIRRQLLLAFLAAPAPLAIAAVVVAGAYLKEARIDLENHFDTAARRALREAATEEQQRELNLRAAAGELTRLIAQQMTAPAEADGLPLPADPSPDGEPTEENVAPIVAQFRAHHPEIKGVRVLYEDAPVFDDLGAGYELTFTGPSEATASEGILFSGKDERLFTLHVDAKAHVTVIAELDCGSLMSPKPIAGRGFVFQFDQQSRRPVHAPADVQRLKALPLDELAEAASKISDHPEVARARGENWRVVRVGLTLGKQGLVLIAVAPEADIYRPLFWTRLGVVLALLTSLALALGLAYLLSGRFVGAVENIRSGVEALSRGEWSKLEKSSNDELGGALVDSMNRMAQRLAERTRREEVEGWRRLVRILSHEINNTLGPVRSVATTVRDQIAGRVADGDAAEDLQLAFRLIVDRTDALAAFLAGYAELAKLPDPERTPVVVEPLLVDAVKLLSEQATARGVDVTLACEPYLGAAPLDRAQIERVLINLIKNAIEAARGEVRVRAVRAAESIDLTVEDDGPGIAPEARAHLFVPYFTTKAGGSGIGLALARQIVLAHGGSIAVEDREGGGTRFRVILPAGVGSG